MDDQDVLEYKKDLNLDWNNPILAASRLKTRTPSYTIPHTSRNSESSLEVLVGGILAVLGIPYKTQVAIGRYVVDFLVGDSLVLEADGLYYHGSPRAKAKDKRRDIYLEKLGYTVVRLPERDIRLDPFNCVLSHFPKKQKPGEREDA